MSHVCKQCQAVFEITDDDLAFYDKVSPVFNGKKELIPPPTLCPDCRLQHRTMFRNERFLYHRKSDLSEKDIVTAYAPDSPYKVYDQEEWWSDDWDAMSFGQDFDFEKTFTEQFKALSLLVPRPSLNTTNAINSTYTNYSLNVKNCYLVFGCTNGEDNMYGRFVIKSKNCVDCLSVYSCEYCYESIASENCYKCSYVVNSKNCSNSMFLEDCVGCSNCMLCFGMRNKEYCIQNQQYSKEEYAQKLQEITPLTRETIDRLHSEFREMAKALPHRYAFITASEDCTGDMISSSKNCKHSFDITDSEDSKYLCYLPFGKNSYDATFCSPAGAENSVNICSSMVYNCSSTFLCWYGTDAHYIISCFQCKNCFGCVGLKHKQYCIFNKQYTKEEYEELVPRIIEHMRSTGEWGEYLAPELSCFAYNETVAQEEFPLKKEEVVSLGWEWRDQKDDTPAVDKLIKADQLPRTINEVPDDILNWAIRCAVSNRPFRIIKQELDYYRTMGIPIPHLHPDERHFARLAQRNKRRLYDCTCDQCGKQIETNYPPENSAIIYCEECYLKEVY